MSSPPTEDPKASAVVQTTGGTSAAASGSGEQGSAGEAGAVRENAVQENTQGNGLARFRQRWLRPYDPLTQLLFTVPVFLIYHLGILFLDIRNGADLVSSVFWSLQSASVGAYVGVTLGVTLGLVLVALYLRKRHKLQPVRFGPILLESTALAIGMWALVGWAVQQISMVATPALSATPLSVGQGMSPFAKVVMSCGAGFHEELVFRVLLFGGLLAVGKRFLAKEWQGLILAGLISSFLFSAIHYVGALGDAFTFTSFFFRFLSGIYLATVYKTRGFAVAVYTHTIYDILVMFFAGA